MKRQHITIILGIVLIAFGVIFAVQNLWLGAIILSAIGLSLIGLGFRPGRASMVVFGHTCIFMGCLLTTWGIYLLPSSQPTLTHIFFRPLFWGLFSIFGGICAIYHGFCRCVRHGYGEQNGK